VLGASVSTPFTSAVWPVVAVPLAKSGPVRPAASATTLCGARSALTNVRRLPWLIVTSALRKRLPEAVT
jgi:hypothetical protein